MKAYLTFDHGSRRIGTLHVELNEKIAPKTVRNFTTFLTTHNSTNEDGKIPSGNYYAGSRVHRLIRGFMLQAGDFTAGDGTGGYSIYGKTFHDENFVLKHDRPGALSMANSGPHTNGSQFFITFRPTPHLDGKHVVFGYVDLDKSGECLRALEEIRTGGGDRPLQPLTIADCGLVKEEDVKQHAATAEIRVDDDNEIDLDESDGGKDDEHDLSQEEPQEEEEEVDESQPLTKAEELKVRLRKLKQKMNQARQLNRQAVKQEGDRVSDQGAIKDRKRQTVQSKEAKKAAWEKQNSKAFTIALEAGIDPKALTEQAEASVYKARIQAEKKESHQYSVNDYHNPEGQHRHYQRDLKSLGKNPQQVHQSTATYNPLQDDVDPQREREGARRIAAEMHRRIEKVQQRQLKRKVEEEGDVSYINQRNKKYNEKINRQYDKHTAEIRDSLERGTAL